MATEHLTREEQLYDNESFWWSAPAHENYLGLDRGPVPAEGAEAAAHPSGRRRPDASAPLPGLLSAQRAAALSVRRSGHSTP